MKTKTILLSLSQELFLRSVIRSSIIRKYVVLDSLNIAGKDTTMFREDIFELKTLYRNLFDEPFTI